MKTIIQSIAITLAVFAGIFALAFGICSLESAADAVVWNNGKCQCGGEFEFSNATHRKNGGNFYYYECVNCGKVIETNHQQVKTHKTHEVAAIVEEYNTESNCSVVMDWNGEAWFYEGELEEGRLVIVVFDDMGTADLYDDEIVEIRIDNQ